jgi:adenine phosphoribosyltransferase
MKHEIQTGYRDHIRAVKDFPKPGILFYDIAPLLANGAVFSHLIDDMASLLEGQIDKVVGFDARGFVFGGAIAAKLGIGFTMLRKPGKLPGETERVGYSLEYGDNELELQAGMIDGGERVALVDDVIATGGTALAGIELVRKQGAKIVEFCSLIDLPRLGGSKRIIDAGVPVRAFLELET